MKRKFICIIIASVVVLSVQAQDRMTAETLWSLGQVSAVSISPNQDELLYQVRYTDIKTEETRVEYRIVQLKNNSQSEDVDWLGNKELISWTKDKIYAKEDGILVLSEDKGKHWYEYAYNLDNARNIKIAPKGDWIAYSKEVKSTPIKANEVYKFAPNAQARIITDLDYRHWDKWNDGRVNHIFLLNIKDGSEKDILDGEPYTSPTKPFGGASDFIFTPDGKGIIYVSKKKTGREYAESTNTDLYYYDLNTGNTTNLTQDNQGYDVAPQFSPDGKSLAWLQMKRDGYEADKNDIIVMDWASKNTRNLSSHWDETVDGNFKWSLDGKEIFFTASIKGTRQLFKVDVPANLFTKNLTVVRQLTKGIFDVGSIVGVTKNEIIVNRSDHNHASELFAVKIKDFKNSMTEEMLALSKVNDSMYEGLELGHSELKMITTRDGHDMGVWVIYPPNFDPQKKYPTLLYCQGGPQSALTQFYSLRWNFQLMAANDYIIVAPNRRGMPGWGVEWNEVISGDWGGGPMNDYLDAIDEIAKEDYVDNERLGAVGASYGGYSVFMLAGIHENRFKTFISHNGLFDVKSWYGTTEELFFANWDTKGNYWTEPIPEAYTKFNPSNYVDKWDTPILIYQSEKDFRVPIEQGLQAFQAAKLKGIKSKLVFFHNENHWVLKPHNGLVWQKEFYKWLMETL